MINRDADGWQGRQGPDSDVVLSSRARLARNVDGYPFVGRASAAERNEVLSVTKRAILDSKLDETMLWVELNHATPRDRRLLVERHLISNQFSEGDVPRAVSVSGNETLSIMINEEDHLRIQKMLPGAQVQVVFKSLYDIDETIEQRLEFAFSERFGYLTACPTNVGTGLRLSVMVHLPGMKLTGEIDKLRRAAKDLQLAVRGFYGEGSEAVGDFYQISNQVTLGVTEEDLLDELQNEIVPRLIDWERSARVVLLERREVLVDDRVHRALGTLRSARLLGDNEAMKLLSRVRLGAALARLEGIDLNAVDRLYVQIQPAHLQQLEGSVLDEEGLKEARARVVRAALQG